MIEPSSSSVLNRQQCEKSPQSWSKVFKLFHQFIVFVVQDLDFLSLLFQTASMLQVMVFHKLPGMIVMSRMFDNDNIWISYQCKQSILAWGIENLLPLVEPPSSFIVVVWAVVESNFLQCNIYVQ